MPGLQGSISRKGTVALAKGEAAFPVAATSLDPGYHGLFSWKGERYIAARSVSDSGDALVYLLLDEQTLASLSTGIVAMHGVSAKDENIDMNFSGSGIKIAVGTGAEKNTAFLLPRARNGGTSPLRAC